MAEYLRQIPWFLVIVACLSLGLAPFNPPHVWEKLNMLLQGKLVRPIDWFDFFLHGTPWALLITKTIVSFLDRTA